MPANTTQSAVRSQRFRRQNIEMLEYVPAQPVPSASPACPDGRDFDRYRHLLDLDRAGWAWEWLRRNPAYAACGPHMTKPAAGHQDRPAVTMLQDTGWGDPWGLCFCRNR
jgi:hypothetical protein